MSFLLNFIPLQYQIIAKYIASAAIALACAYGGHSLTKMYYQPKIQTLEIRAKQFEDAYNAIAISVVNQNQGISDLKKAQDIKAKEIEVAKDKAKIESSKYKDEAKVILRKTSVTEDICKEANDLISSELTSERDTK